MLHIHFANRFETLADGVCARLGAAHVFHEDHVIVPSAAIRRALTLELARRHGICANLRFSYLARWLWHLIGRLVPGVPDESPFDPPVLAWRIDAALSDAAWAAAQPRLAAYLNSADPVMRFELATRVATLFDQYLTYRPDWLEAWSRGESVRLAGPGPDPGAGADTADAAAHQAWQAALWRRLAAELGTEGRDPVAAFVQALAAPTRPADPHPALPATVHVFGLPAMPPLHLGLLQALSRRIEVHVYALNPCREYWFETVDRRRLGQLAARGQVDHHEEGQRLLAAWGQQAQSQLGLLVEASGEQAIDDNHFSAHPGDSLLARLHNSILELTDLASGSVALAAHDRSIEVHVCHSLTREIEVLHDRLLGLFARPDAPALGDVLVVTPDLDAAAPLIDAIFGTAPKPRYVAYSVTGRARSHVNPVARALLELLALTASRCTGNEVFSLLQQPLVARKFGLDADALEQVRGWLQDAGVHWALDAEHRASLGLPDVARHSFADGLDRLFLGYALPSQGGRAQLQLPFEGRLPAGNAHGSDALALGALWRFVDSLAQLRRTLASPQPARAWPALLADALDGFVAARDHELDDLNEVQAALAELESQFERSELSQAVPVDVVRLALAQALEDPAGGGVPTGRVTFASMSSLRNLPFKVVCAIGLNDGAFPTATRPSEFDLMALQVRRGDRQRRSDERNLFLDLLLAARDNLHLSYVGRSVRDNAVLTPSVLVSELLEYLVPAIATPAADATALAQARARLVIEHPLQPFGEAGFRIDADIRQRSFHSEYAQALRHNLAATPAWPGIADDLFDADDIDADAAGVEPAAPFLAAPLAEPGEEWRHVPLQRLDQFFRNPCRYLLERRLGIELRWDEDELQDDEPFVLSVPARSALAQRLLPALLSGADIATARTLALAGTEVPLGAFGRRALDHELETLHAFALSLLEATREPIIAPHTVSLDLQLGAQAWRIDAAFTDLRCAGLVRYRYDDARPRDYLSAWLLHLMLCAQAPAGVQPRTIGWARDQRFCFAPVAQPLPILHTLLGLYQRGLREPLAFFPKTAWAWVESRGSLSAAAQAWRVSAFRPFAESADVAYRLALRGRADPLGPGLAEFDACAHAVLDPLLASLERPPL